jgi:hypothetical protein
LIAHQDVVSGNQNLLSASQSVVSAGWVLRSARQGVLSAREGAASEVRTVLALFQQLAIGNASAEQFAKRFGLRRFLERLRRPWLLSSRMARRLSHAWLGRNPNKRRTGATPELATL